MSLEQAQADRVAQVAHELDQLQRERAATVAKLEDLDDRIEVLTETVKVVKDMRVVKP